MNARPTASSAEFEISGLFSALTHKAGSLRVTDEEIGSYLSECFVEDEDWVVLQDRLQQEQIQGQVENIRSRLQEAVRKNVITVWLQQNCASEAESICHNLFGEIDSYAKNGQLPELRSYLIDVLTLGQKRAYKNQKRKRWGRWWNYVWEILVGTFRLALTIGILIAAQTKFETIAFALLILIYHDSSGMRSSLVQLHNSWFVSSDGQFRILRRLLRQRKTDDEEEEEANERRNLHSTVGREAVRHIIRSAFFGLAWLVAIGDLIYNLL